MILGDPIPDALLIPERLKHGDNVIRRCNSIFDIAEPMLGLPPGKKRQAFARTHPGDPGQGNVLFVSPREDATINFPTRHPLAGRPQYVWVPGPNGIKLGFYVPEAKLENMIRG